MKKQHQKQFPMRRVNTGCGNSSGLFLTNNDYIDNLQQSKWFRLHDIKRLSTQIQLIKKYTLEIAAASLAAAAQIQMFSPACPSFDSST